MFNDLHHRVPRQAKRQRMFTEQHDEIVMRGWGVSSKFLTRDVMMQKIAEIKATYGVEYTPAQIRVRVQTLTRTPRKDASRYGMTDPRSKAALVREIMAKKAQKKNMAATNRLVEQSLEYQREAAERAEHERQAKKERMRKYDWYKAIPKTEKLPYDPEQHRRARHYVGNFEL